MMKNDFTIIRQHAYNKFRGEEYDRYWRINQNYGIGIQSVW
jgi:hypothetical protein